MDLWSETAVLFSSSLNSPENFSKLIWDNETKHDIINEVLEQQKYPYFLLGWVFLGAFGTGFFIHCFYSLVFKRLFPDDEWDSTDGHFNPAYVDDESQPPENDQPPTYDSLMSGESINETTGNQRLRNFLRKLVPKKETIKEETQSEETPPSYSSALANLQCEISSP